MESISWKNEFSVGVAEMDQQHQKLLAMIARLVDEQHRLTDPKTIAELLTAMTDYAEEHFRAEEYLMAEYGYDHADRQVRQHQAFIDKTHEFMNASVGPNILSSALLEFLNSWLINHILHEDMRYKAFFNGKGLF
jgi:hemerythrin